MCVYAFKNPASFVLVKTVPFSFFQAQNIITLYDVSNIWRVPLLLKVIGFIRDSTDSCTQPSFVVKDAESLFSS